MVSSVKFFSGFCADMMNGKLSHDVIMAGGVVPTERATCRDIECRPDVVGGKWTARAMGELLYYYSCLATRSLMRQTRLSGSIANPPLQLGLGLVLEAPHQSIMRHIHYLLLLLGGNLACLTRPIEASPSCAANKDACKDRCGIAKETARDAIQAFYYPWYRYSPDPYDWKHWNESRPIDGSPNYFPPHDLASPFYPKLGAYSSDDKDTIDTHMKWMKEAGIGVVIVSWWGRDTFEDKRVWDILNAADDKEMKVAFYVEPQDVGYVHKSLTQPNRTVGSRTPFQVQRDVMYLIDKYGCHRAVHRKDGRPVFLFFAARQYMSGKQDEWKQAWDELHSNPQYNPIVIAHDYKLANRIIAGGWDGGHVYGCCKLNAKYWKLLAQQYEIAGKIFYFTVCPGYDKSRKSPSDEPVIDRENGRLYEKLWQTAIESKRPSSVVVITTFNEWHEGTAIEPATPHKVEPYHYNGTNFTSYVYNDYEHAFGKTGEEAAFAYLAATKEFSDRFLDVTFSDEMSGS